MADLTDEEALAILAEDALKPKAGGARGARRDTTEPRIAQIWFAQVHHLTLPCDNPDCNDPRPTTDKGRNVTALVQGKNMCRYCFLDGWLSPAKNNENG